MRVSGRPLVDHSGGIARPVYLWVSPPVLAVGEGWPYPSVCPFSQSFIDTLYPVDAPEDTAPIFMRVALLGQPPASLSALLLAATADLRASASEREAPQARTPLSCLAGVALGLTMRFLSFYGLTMRFLSSLYDLAGPSRYQLVSIYLSSQQTSRQRHCTVSMLVLRDCLRRDTALI